MDGKKIKVTIWNENVHETEQNALGDVCRRHYPHGIHNYLKDALAADDLEIRAVSLDMPEQGMPDSLIQDTDVLLWWGTALTRGSRTHSPTSSRRGCLTAWG